MMSSGGIRLRPSTDVDGRRRAWCEWVFNRRDHDILRNRQRRACVTGRRRPSATPTVAALTDQTVSDAMTTLIEQGRSSISRASYVNCLFYGKRLTSVLCYILVTVIVFLSSYITLVSYKSGDYIVARERL